MRRIALLGLGVALALACAPVTAASARSAGRTVEVRSPAGGLLPAGAAVHVAATSTAGDRTDLRGVDALGGLVRAQQVIVPQHGFAGARIDGLVVAGRAIAVHPNTLVSLGSTGYLVALEEAVAEGAGGVIGLHIHLLVPFAGIAAGSNLEIGLAVASTKASVRVQATPSAGALPGLTPLGRTLGDQAVAIARAYVGTPYVWGGGSPDAGFDCSGLTQYVYGKLGIQLTHYAASQWHEGRRLTAREVRPGDLVFFEPGFDGPGHVGIYIGGGKFIDAPHTGDVIRISSFAGSKWAALYVGAVRPY
jgi:cell wall-associated NlpC family hydrolase